MNECKPLVPTCDLASIIRPWLQVPLRVHVLRESSPLQQGRAVQVDIVETRVESAFAFSA